MRFPVPAVKKVWGSEVQSVVGRRFHERRPLAINLFDGQRIGKGELIIRGDANDGPVQLVQFVQTGDVRAGDIAVAEPLWSDLGGEGAGKVAKGMAEVIVYNLAACFSSLIPCRGTRN